MRGSLVSAPGSLSQSVTPGSPGQTGQRPCVCERDSGQRRPLAVFFSSFYPKKGAVLALAFLSPRGERGWCAEWFVFFSFKLVNVFVFIFFLPLFLGSVPSGLVSLVPD